jgi:hypothetical protein
MIANFAMRNFDPVLVKGLALEALQFDPEDTQGQFYT